MGTTASRRVGRTADPTDELPQQQWAAASRAMQSGHCYPRNRRQQHRQSQQASFDPGTGTQYNGHARAAAEPSPAKWIRTAAGDGPCGQPTERRPY
eukprot:9160722-Prorocentrum_lima.AAC.1